MPQLGFYYQQQSDPDWFLPIVVPDLAWLQTHAKAITPLPPRWSLLVESSRFLVSPPIDQPDLAWLQTYGKALPPLPPRWSLIADTSRFLASPPIDQPDLSWMHTHGRAITPLPPRWSVRTDASWVGSIPTPPDLAWLQTQAPTIRLAVLRTASGRGSDEVLSRAQHLADTSAFVPIPAVPDLAWLQDSAAIASISLFDACTSGMPLANVPRGGRQNPGGGSSGGNGGGNGGNPPTSIPPPDGLLTWLQTRASTREPLPSLFRSLGADASSILQGLPTPDLSWMGAAPGFPRCLPPSRSVLANPSWMLQGAGPTDLAWLHTHGQWLPSPPAPPGAHVDSSWVLTPAPVGLLWKPTWSPTATHRWPIPSQEHNAHSVLLHHYHVSWFLERKDGH